MSAARGQESLKAAVGEATVQGEQGPGAIVDDVAVVARGDELGADSSLHAAIGDEAAIGAAVAERLDFWRVA